MKLDSMPSKRKTFIIILFLVLGWIAIQSLLTMLESNRYFDLQKSFHRTKHRGVILEQSTGKPVGNAWVKYSYLAYSKINTFSARFNHTSRTRICYATYYTETNDKGEFTIPPLPKEIKLKEKDDRNRNMHADSSMTLYHPSYIFMSGPWPRNVYFSFSIDPKLPKTIIQPYLNNMDPETRYMYLGAKEGDSCGELLSSPDSFNNTLHTEIKKLEEDGAQYNAMKMKWGGPT